MLTDNYGQGIKFPTLSDKPNAQTAFQALVDGISPRLVMIFSSATTRGATISAPKEGMVTWLKDVNRLEVYDGAAWVTVGAGTSAWSTVALGSGWSHDGNDNGNLQYRVVNLFGEKTVMFRGGIGRSSYPSTVPEMFQITSSALPTSARPGTKRTFGVACSDLHSDRIGLKVDLLTNGHIQVWGTQSNVKPPWVSFNGCYVSL